jgi:CubicO group peptidase (beta-lactamase class C family)
MVTPHTVFEGASLGKPAFAYAVLALEAAGLIDLDTALSAYVSYEPVAHDPRHTAVTARRVLSHQTGLPNWRREGGPLEFEFDPGSRFGYSGEGYMYLQRAIEHIMEEPAGLVARALVFDHFNMQRSRFVPDSKTVSDYATGHDGTGTPIDKTWPDAAYVAYGLHTTVLDFSRLMLGIRNERALDEPAATRAVGWQVDVHPTAVGWGLGWGIETTAAGPAIWHWGDNPGFKHYAYLALASGNGIVVFTNADGGMAIMPEIVTLALGAEPLGLGWLDYPRYGGQ